MLCILVRYLIETVAIDLLAPVPAGVEDALPRIIAAYERCRPARRCRRRFWRRKSTASSGSSG
jgi:hypothetical protein